MHVNLYEDEDGGGYWYHGMHDCPYFLTNNFVLYQNNSAPKEINEYPYYDEFIIVKCPSCIPREKGST